MSDFNTGYHILYTHTHTHTHTSAAWKTQG